MSLYKRKNSPNFYYKLYCKKTGEVLQGSTETTDKTKAQEFHDRLKADLWNQAKLGEKPTYLWEHAVAQYLAPREKQRSIKTTKCGLRWLEPWLIGKSLTEINVELINEIKAAKQKDIVHIRGKSGYKKSTNRKVAPATVNRILRAISAVLNVAHSLGWLNAVPKSKLLGVPKKRIRWLTPQEAERLLSLLPSHLADMAQFSLETGLRRSNVTGLEWSQINLAEKSAWIHPDQAKGGRAISVPLSDTAIEVLMRQRGMQREASHNARVFLYKGKSIKEVSTKAWYKALKAADIKNFRWHDLRHTWASWHVQRGTPLYVLKELGGWESLEMVQRYAHLSSAHLAQWVQPHTTFTPRTEFITACSQRTAA